MYTGTSIVEYLISEGRPYSFAERSKLANEYGITNYTGTAEQNTKLLNMLRNGTAPSSSKSSGTGVKNTGSSSSNSLSSSGENKKNDSYIYDIPQAVQPIEFNYTTSPQTQQAYDALLSFRNNAPGQYNSSYTAQIQNILNRIQNRQPFEYNADSDPLYAQYRDKYTAQGKMAMQDSMANAALLSGGYGNSYASQVGQQTYDAYLDRLNDVIPELYSLAYNKYQSEGNDLYNQMSLYQNLENSDYARYRDSVSDYYNQLSLLQNDYSNLLAQDNWLNQMNYQTLQDAQTQANWQAQFDYAKEQDALAQQNWQTQFDYQKAQDDMDYALALAKANETESPAQNQTSGNLDIYRDYFSARKDYSPADNAQYLFNANLSQEEKLQLASEWGCYSEYVALEKKYLADQRGNTLNLQTINTQMPYQQAQGISLSNAGKILNAVETGVIDFERALSLANQYGCMNELNMLRNF